MKIKTSIKISEQNKDFLKRFRNNRRKLGIDLEDLSYSQLLDLIERYFKLDNDAYMEVIKLK